MIDVKTDFDRALDEMWSAISPAPHEQNMERLEIDPKLLEAFCQFMKMAQIEAVPHWPDWFLEGVR